MITDSLSARRTSPCGQCDLRKSIADGSQRMPSGSIEEFRGFLPSSSEACIPLSSAQLSHDSGFLSVRTPGGGMARALIMAIAAFAGAALNGAHAQEGPWCAYLTGGTPNCAFATFAECIKAIQGKTAICDRNADYLGPAEADSGSPSAATPNSAATGTTGAERGEARQHRARHRSAHHLRSRKIETRNGRRHRANSHRNRER